MATYDGTSAYTVSAPSSASVDGSNDYLVLASSDTVTGATPYVVVAPTAPAQLMRRTGSTLTPVQLGRRSGNTLVWLSPEV